MLCPSVFFIYFVIFFFFFVSCSAFFDSMFGDLLIVVVMTRDKIILYSSQIADILVCFCFELHS